MEKIAPITILEYIKASIDIYVDLRADELLKNKTNKNKKENNNSNTSDNEYLEDLETSPNEYEKLLRKHEADIRNYIKVIFIIKISNNLVKSNFIFYL